MNKKELSNKEALDYHSQGRPGKIEVISSKSCKTQRDLSLAYSPGVAQPCIEIHKSPEDVYKYTAKGNLVAVISNGTAVLGLGNLGPLGAKPVMEGKGILFKKFADIDVFDLEIGTEDPEKFIQCVKLLEPTFGGINLEDIKAPECFTIEERLKAEMQIPVFHDDQHGTAIISGAAFLNALLLVEKPIDRVKIVFSGGGAAALSCAELYVKLGAKRENILLCDSQGVIFEGRKEGMNKYKQAFATKLKVRTLTEAMKDADVFVGLSVAGAVTPDMVKSMAKKPIVFAMANPDPEIGYDEATAARNDIIFATGRSDYPNQVNNVLGFPFIFRGALDVSAKAINEEMKIAAVHALAKLARQEVPESVSKAYGGKRFRFGPEYIIPKPFDSRVLLWVCPAVAKAAIDSGVARRKIDLDEYVNGLERRLGVRQSFVASIREKITTANEGNSRPAHRIVFPEGANSRILRACDIIVQEGIAEPILLGNEKRIQTAIEKLGLESLKHVRIVTPSTAENREAYAIDLWESRQRRGFTREQVYSLMKNENYFGSMMVRRGDADGLLSGVTQSYPETIRPFLHVVGARKGMKIAGVYMMLFRDRVIFFADTTVNIDPTASDLADIAICAAEEARFFDIEPKVAMLSFSNFGSNNHPQALKVREATHLVKGRRPDILIDGEMQADTAIVPEIVDESFPFCEIKGGANVLIFPDLQSANICYKLMQRMGGAEAVGPILVGMNKPINVLQRSADVDEIVNMAMITVLEIKKMEPFRRQSMVSPMARA
ncbi:MAG: NADP-dependent malic enzyme [Deltaproteobacteria bacterium]|nr:NADP-dependent malic enzyme [Deltaproteobacteria bacterium]